MSKTMPLTAFTIALLSTVTAAQAQNSAQIAQTGASDTIDVQQFAGHAGEVVINQTGERNAIVATQKDAEQGAIRPTPANQLTIVQGGKDNAINKTLLSLPKLGQDASQNGAPTNAVTIQQAGNFNEISYFQTSWGNTAKIKQGSTAGRTPGDHDTIAFLQNQDHNTLTIGQDGSSNHVLAKQHFEKSTLTLDQDGTGNDALIDQAHNDVATITQGGVAGSITVNQSDLFDTATIDQAGFANSLDLFQQKSHDTATLVQGGSFNTLSVTQKSSGAFADVSQTGSLGHITLSQ